MAPEQKWSIPGFEPGTSCKESYHETKWTHPSKSRQLPTYWGVLRLCHRREWLRQGVPWPSHLDCGNGEYRHDECRGGRPHNNNQPDNDYDKQRAGVKQNKTQEIGRHRANTRENKIQIETKTERSGAAPARQKLGPRTGAAARCTTWGQAIGMTNHTQLF